MFIEKYRELERIKYFDVGWKSVCCILLSCECFDVKIFLDEKFYASVCESGKCGVLFLFYFKKYTIY